jgi:ketosteroid isomerase-like protein
MSRDEKLAVARRYLRAVEAGAVAELRTVVAPDFEQREWPNPMSPAGARRNLPEVLRAAELGRDVVSDQVFQIASEAVDGDRVIMEVNWSATLKVDFPDRPSGSRLRARIAIFLVVRNGLVASQDNYDAYLPD